MEEEFDFSDILDKLDFLDPITDKLDPTVKKPNQFSTNKPVTPSALRKQQEAKNASYSDKLFKARSNRAKNINQIMTGGKAMFDFSDILDNEIAKTNLQGPYRGPE